MIYTMIGNMGWFLVSTDSTQAFLFGKLSRFATSLGQRNWLHIFDGKLNDGRTQNGTTWQGFGRNCLVAGVFFFDFQVKSLGIFFDSTQKE